jgi:hypothetical protein
MGASMSIPDVRKSLIGMIALTFVLLYAGVWVAIAWKLARFHASPGHAQVHIADAVMTTAGFLSTTVGAGTAAVLGITIAQATTAGANETRTLGKRITDSAANSTILFVGVSVYFIVGIAVLLAWLFKSSEAPDVIKTFALGILGWAGGAFSSVFRAKTGS